LKKKAQNGWKTVDAPLFDLRGTMASGQLFHWEPTEGGGFRGLIDTTEVEVRQEGERLRFRGGSAELLCHYFALDHPLEAIYATFPDDPAMREAVAFGRGLRIVRQPAWECLATFITSAMKQVSHITAMSRALRERFGEPIGHGGFRYPDPARLASADEAALRECGLGFRAPKLLETARWIAEGRVDLEAIRALPDGEAERELCRLPGVGPKIAHCVLLFAYERVKAFPVDVWIARVLLHHYFARKRKKPTLKELHAFGIHHFGPYGGYAQQYLFHHARNLPRSTWAKTG